VVVAITTAYHLSPPSPRRSPVGRLPFTADGTAFNYTYTANSNLLASVANSASGWSQARTYVSNRDLLDVIETKVSTMNKASFDHAHDNLGRRTSVAKSGELYSRYGNGTQGLDTAWSYDDRSQVTGEVTKLGGSSTVLTGRDDAYAFDNIGNRSTKEGEIGSGFVEGEIGSGFVVCG
jgi:hypothetical protein